MHAVAEQILRVFRGEGVIGLMRRVFTPVVWKKLAIQVGLIPDQRDILAQRYVSGIGMEIGALARPLALPAKASVSYVDRMSSNDLARVYPELGDKPLVEVDIIDDGEYLRHTPDGSQDFIIANHFLEHCENPLGTIRHHLSKVKPAGILFYALPDKRFSFDTDRPLTPFEHLVADDRDGPGSSRWKHYREWAQLVVGEGDPQRRNACALTLMHSHYSIHFHVWDQHSFAGFLERAGSYLAGAFEVKECKANGGEFIVVLQRT